MAIEDKIKELEKSISNLKKPVVELSGALGMVVGMAEGLAAK